MTSRETTRFLPIADSSAAAGTHRRSPADWAMLLGFAALQWPWLLRSLDGGRRRAKRALLDRLGLPHDALPNLGSWKADMGLLTLVTDHIFAARPRLVVEFGAGASTLIIARALQMAGGGRLISFDQHKVFVDSTRQWLADHGWPGLWYDHGPLPDGIDLMLIDGPPWTVHPFTRGAAATLFGQIARRGTIMLDDAARPGERIVARRWHKAWPEFDFRLSKCGSKGTLIATRR